jgi:hypothetical protein
MSSFSSISVITRARQHLRDVAPHRFTGAYLTPYVDDGVAEIGAARPDLGLAENGLTVATPTIGTLPANFLPALGHYVAAKAFADEDMDTHNPDLARYHMEQFKRIAFGG